MRSAGRAIVLKENKILLMKRFKMGSTYYTLPGGRVDAGETSEQAAVREVKEETSLVVKEPRLVFVEDAGDPYGVQYIYMCQYVSGEPNLPAESEEAFWSTPGKNTYEPLWLDLSELEGVPMVSPLLKQAILRSLEQGFPENPLSFSSKHAERLS